LGEAFDLLWVFGGFVGSIALGLDWSGKSMNHFVGWEFFSVGRLKLNSKSVAKCFFLTPGITHKIPCFRAVQCPGMKMKSAGNF
jgi:hypothetical protein